MVNHDLMRYDYKEGVDFKGLLPEFIAETSAATVGHSDVVVEGFGFEAKGMDALEVIDVQGIME